MNSKEKSKIIIRILNKIYPKVPIPLNYKNTFTLLVSVLYLGSWGFPIPVEWLAGWFGQAVDNPVIQYLDNQHIRKVILDFLYPHKKPKNRIRLWFFVEQHKNQKLHIHFLIEQVDYE